MSKALDKCAQPAPRNPYATEATARSSDMLSSVPSLPSSHKPVCSSGHSPAVLVSEELEWYLRLERAFAVFPESKVPKPYRAHPVLTAATEEELGILGGVSRELAHVLCCSLERVE